jgi:hypothetical protein
MKNEKPNKNQKKLVEHGIEYLETSFAGSGNGGFALRLKNN